MKKRIMLLALTGVAILLGGCATSSNVSPSSDPVAAYLPWVEGAAQLATGSYLNFGVTDITKRTNLANQIDSAGAAVYSVTNNQAVTPAQLQTVMLSFNWNADATTYAGYVNAAVAVYQLALAKIPPGSTSAQTITYSTEILNAIAKGTQQGAATYATIAVNLPTSL